MSKFRAAAVVIVAIAIASTAAFAAGYFPGFPIVGGASYCASQTTAGVPGTASVCNVTVPAGPATLTGNELGTFDTGLPSGQQPQTVQITATLLGAGATNYQAPLTGASLVANFNETTMLVDPAGTIAALTVTMPGPVASLKDGQVWRLASSQTVTALTLTPASGTTIAAQTPTAITISTTGAYNYEFIYKASNAKWYRLQ